MPAFVAYAAKSSSAAAVIGYLAMVVLAVVASPVLRWVAAGEMVLVVRGDVVRRVVRRGPVWRWPLLERFERSIVAEHDVPLAVRATTRDDVPVLVLAEMRVRVRPPVAGTTYVDPLAGAERAAESVIAEAVRTWTVSGLVDAAASADRPLLPTARAAARPHGVEVITLDVVAFDVVISDVSLPGDPGDR